MKEIMKGILNKMLSSVLITSMAASLTVQQASAENRTDAHLSEYGKRSYSSGYTQITVLPSYNDRGRDGWRNGLVTGNGENGIVESCGPAEDVMIFQNIKFGYPTNAVRVTPDMSSARDEAAQSIINYNGEYLSAAGAQHASDIMIGAASKWVKEMNLSNSWNLQNTYAFHPGHQLRIKMLGAKNGEEKAYERYTDYHTAEIGTNWTDADNNTWERKSFSSREDNVNITSLKSTNGTKINMELTIDDISRMSNEGGVDTKLADIRYRKIVSQNGDYIGWVAHYPYYHNSTFNNAGLAGVTRIIIKGGNKEYVFGTETADTYANPVGGATETVINLGYDKAPKVKITDAEEVYLITKTDRDLDMGTLGEFEEQINTENNIKNGTAYTIVNNLIEATANTADKYSSDADYADFDYNSALEPSAQKHSEIFNRLSYSVCVSDEDKAMRGYNNEDLIAAQKVSKDKLLPAMLERMYYNGRFANICSSGIQAPRLGGMWTGAWGCEWSGDYTTDANINLQIAGANIGSVPEETIGFINVMLKNITDWELNAKQVYGIEDALLAPPRTDGYSAVLTHFNQGFPGQMWNSGASWLILPMFEYYQCYGNAHIPLTEDIREKLEFTGNEYEGYTEIIDKKGTQGAYHNYNITKKNGDTIIYNMRNTLMLSDERAEQILNQGYFELTRDILYPMLTKTVNFWLNFVSPKYYTKNGQGFYDADKTELEEGEYYLLSPGYSPENWAKNTGKTYTANSVMDISSTKSALEMAIRLEEYINTADKNTRIEKYTYLTEHLPPYLYEATGELKEWALKGYEENYGHRHGSQLYGLWPSYEGESDMRLFDGAAKLIETKNSINTGDSKSGHGWLHRGLVMARLKNGKGVRDTLVPLAATNMIYSSMMMAHNIDMTAAYCTDPVITIPAIELESIVYSDDNTIELLPAMLPETEEGGELSGTVGMGLRNGGTISYIRWDKNTVAANIKNSSGTKLKLAKAYDSIIVDGTNVTEQILTDETGESYYMINTDDEISVKYVKSNIQNGTYKLKTNSALYLAVCDTVNGSVVEENSVSSDNRMALWNVETVTNNAFKLINTYTGKVLTFDGTKLIQKNYAGEISQLWTVLEGKIMSLSGHEHNVSLEGMDFTDIQTTIDTVTITAEKTNVRNGQSISLSAITEPLNGIGSGIEWAVTNGTGRASVNGDGILTASAAGTVSVYAKAKLGGAKSNVIDIDILAGLEDYKHITEDYYTIFGRKDGKWEPQNPPENAFDGDPATAYDGQKGGYCGIEFKEPQNITAFKYMQRENQIGRMQGTVFQVSNDGEHYTTIYTVSREDGYGTYCPVFADDLNDEAKELLSNKVKYFRFYSGASDFANIAEIAVYTDKLSGEIEISDYDNIIWADDIVVNGGNHQGSNGNAIKSDFGNFKNVDNTIKIFFPAAENANPIGEHTRINALDNQGGAWAGYTELSVTAKKPGEYKMYILCNTNDSGRGLEVKNETAQTSSVGTVNGNHYSTLDYMQVISVDISLAEGSNLLKFQAPSGKTAPNFIAMTIVGLSNSEMDIVDLSKCDIYYLTGEKGDGSAVYCEVSGTVSNLYDDDLSTVSNAAIKHITAFDISEYASKIKRIEYSINGSANAGANFLYGASKLDTDTSVGAESSVAWQIIYRTNGTVAEGIKIEQNTIDTESGIGTGTLTGDFSKWKYIGVSNGSGSCKVSELKLYFSNEDEAREPTAEVIKYNVINDDIKTTVADVTVMVEDAENTVLYTAVYKDGALEAVKVSKITTSGESEIPIGLTTDSGNTIKLFMWREMTPLMDTIIIR